MLSMVSVYGVGSMIESAAVCVKRVTTRTNSSGHGMQPIFRTALLATVLAGALLLAGAFDVQPAQAAGENGEARGRDAAAAMQRGQIEKATQLYTEALADTGLPNSRRAALHNDRGVAFARLNQSRVAIDDFNRAVQLSPETASIYNNRGNVLLTIGFGREAVKDFDRALLLAPGYAAAYSNRANALARLGENDAAVRDFSHAIRLVPQNAAALTGRGRLHLSQNRPHAALRDFSRAVGHDARFGAGYKARADAKLALLRFDEAIEDLSRAVAFDPTNLDIYLVRGYAYLASKNAASAIKDFARAAEINQRSNAAFEGLALANAKAEAFDDALNDIAKALDIDPRSAQAYAYRAIVYKWMGQPDLGARDVERAVKIDASQPEVLWARAEIAEAAGQRPDAIPDYRKALAERPLLRDAATALDRLGAGEPGEVEVRELGFEKWRVFQAQGRLFASHPELPKLQVPLETMSEVIPKLIEWDTKKIPVKGYGVLRFTAGQADGKDGPEAIEHAAVIDMQGKSVIAVETVRQGNRAAQWAWEEEKLTVTSVDGFKEEYALRAKPREIAQQPKEAPQRRASSRSNDDDSPSWIPWGNNNNGNRRSQKPKSLFDLLFN